MGVYDTRHKRWPSNSYMDNKETNVALAWEDTTSDKGRSKAQTNGKEGRGGKDGGRDVTAWRPALPTPTQFLWAA
jgi:hypothetical protein